MRCIAPFPQAFSAPFPLLLHSGVLAEFLGAQGNSTVVVPAIANLRIELVLQSDFAVEQAMNGRCILVALICRCSVIVGVAPTCSNVLVTLGGSRWQQHHLDGGLLLPRCCRSEEPSAWPLRGNWLPTGFF